MALAAACGDDDPAPSPAPIPEILSFEADPTQLDGPGSVQLSWQTEGAERLLLLREGEDLPLQDPLPKSGSIEVAVDRTTTFELRAQGRGGEEAKATRTVEVTGPPAIASFTAPPLVSADEAGEATVELRWSGIERATSLELASSDGGDPTSLEVAAEGRLEVVVREDTTFTLIASNGAGEAREERTVRLILLPTIASLEVDRPYLGAGEEVEIAWITQGAAAVELRVNGVRLEGVEPHRTSGSWSVSVLSAAAIELRAFDEAGGVVAEEVQVEVGPPMVHAFEAVANRLWLGDPLQLSWSTVGASDFELRAEGLDDPLCVPADLRAMEASGCEWSPPRPGTFMLSLVIANGSGVASDTLSLLVGEGPVITSFTLRPAEITEGDPIELGWEGAPDPDGEEPVFTVRDDRGNLYLAQGVQEIPPSSGIGRFLFTATAETSSPRSTPATAEAELLVHGMPTASLEAIPEVFDETEVDAVELRWTSTHAERLALFRLEGEIAILVEEIQADRRAEGSLAFVPDLDRATYQLVATNPLGVTATAEVEVRRAPPEVLRFEADVTEVVVGQPVELSWETKMGDETLLSLVERGYLRGETTERYRDIGGEGATQLPLSGECFPGGAIGVNGCARLDFPDGFAFPFEGRRTSARVYSPGLVSFDVEDLESAIHSNGTFPTSPLYDFVHLAAFWDRLTWDEARYPAGNVSYLLRQGEQGRSLVIQWKDATFDEAAHRSARLNFQIILWEDGSFEYRYGELEPGPDPSAELAARVEGAWAAIGFQTPSQASYDTRLYQNVLPVRGSLYQRSFLYQPAPPIEASGSLRWYPSTTQDSAEARLEVRRGPLGDERGLSVRVYPRPEIRLDQWPLAPMPVDQPFRIGWSTAFASSFEVLNEAGATIHTAPDLAGVEEGFLVLHEATEGIHRYRLRATGALGYQQEKTVEVRVFEPFGIVRFEADAAVLEPGDVLRLEWETFNAPTIRLLANGVDLLPPGASSGPGELILSDIEENTTFVLQVENSVGMVMEEVIEVQMWNVRFDLSASSTRIRPGQPVTIAVDAADLNGGPRPPIYGTFPMEEVEGEAFVDISSLSEAVEIRSPTFGNVGVDADFPPGFTFPYFGTSYGAFRAFSLGYLSFSLGVLGSSGNRTLPAGGGAVFGGVHLAPFWDNLHARDQGSIWSAPLDADTFAIQWKSMSHATGSSTTNRYDLDFQIVLRRDGSFDYRYGSLTPPPTPSAACSPESCENEANAASATIGFQMPGGESGHTFFHGEGAPYPGGLSNRTFRYRPATARTEFTVRPLRSETYTYCVLWHGKTVCQSLEVEAPFGLESFSVDADVVPFGQAVELSWASQGGTQLVIRDGSGTILFSTDDLDRIDQGSWITTPGSNTAYTLELLAEGNRQAATVEVEVIRMSLTATGPAGSTPGSPVTIGWNLGTTDPALQPVVLAPMEEASQLRFADLDISDDPDADLLIGAGSINRVEPHEFKGGFTFEYLGTPTQAVHVASNGYLSFDLSSTVSASSNTVLPNDTITARRVHVAPFWETLHTRSSGRVLAKLVNPDTYVIQWSRISVSAGSTDANEYNLNFMVVLHRGGDFEFRYGAMSTPPVASSSCFPESCHNEANGSSATIGYQDVSGTAGFTLHFESAANRMRPVPGGLGGRSWRFTKRGASGQVQVRPWDDVAYRICARDGISGDVSCAEPVEIEVDWGIGSFTASTTTPPRGTEVVLGWDVVGLDSITILADDVPILTQSGETLQPQGSFSQLPTEDVVYTLVGSSWGRIVSAAEEIRIRTFELQVVEPVGRYFPGDDFPISWSATALEPGFLSLSSPMFEIDAGPGQEGAFLDLASLEGASSAGLSNTGNGFAEVTLPFAFPYFGASYDRVRAYVDGYLSFDLMGGAGTGSNTQLPSDSTANRRIHLAPFWDDLIVRGPDTIWTFQPDPQTFIIQWKSFNRADGSAAPASLYDLNFQVVLRADGSFDYRYGAMTPPAVAAPSGCFPCTAEARGSSATIGYQTVDGQVGSTLHHGAGEELPGGLANRSFRFAPLLHGSTSVRADTTTEYRICGQLEDFRDCKTVVLRPVADPGDLMITELMIDPAGGASHQWFELRNLRQEPLDLDGFLIASGAASHRITGPLVVPPGGFTVLAASDDAVAGSPYVYGAQPVLDRQVGSLGLQAGTATIASVSWGGSWFIPAGASLGLDPSAHWRGTVSNDDFESWCEQGVGSPGAIGVGCRNQRYDVDPASGGSFHDISRVGKKLRAFETASAMVELAFPGLAFPFFGGIHDRLWVGSNGWISFADELTTGGSTGAPSASGLPRSPTSNPRGPLIAAFWDLLRCDPVVYDCAFHFHLGEFDGEELLILQWKGFRRSSGVGSITFQAQLAKNGDIRIAFGEVRSDDAPGSSGWNNYHGGSAWIGVEGEDPEDFLTAHIRRPVDLGHRTLHFRRK